jgi:polyphosphate kinase 2
MANAKKRADGAAGAALTSATVTSGADGKTQGAPSEALGFRTTKIPNKIYNAELYRLQGELGKLQTWVKSTDARVVVVFEGRDAAGKGGTIKRITEYLSPRVARIAALPAPTEREKGQWYFQRYVEHLPSAGEMVLFDRSWYNRAGVEKVMGFCTPEEHKRFLRQCPIFEQMLVEDGIYLRKYWFSVSDDVQLERFRKRLTDPLRQWKLSPIDLESITRWEDFSRAKDEMMVHTDTQIAPWHHVASDSKKQARLNMIHHLLDSLPYREVQQEKVRLPERPAGTGYQRPSIEVSSYVPDWASTLVEDPSRH